MELNFFKAGLKVEFSESSLDNEYFLQEYLRLNTNAKINEWKSKASKVDFDDNTKIIFELLLDLKKDIARIENYLFKNDELIPLNNEDLACGLNFDYFSFENENFIKDKTYYARFNVNDQKVAIFAKAINEKILKIIKIKAGDRSIYDAFVVDIQRDIIKTMKG